MYLFKGFQRVSIRIISQWVKMANEQYSGANGSCIAAIAAGSLVCNAAAVKFGKRPVYIATTVGLAVSAFWAAESKSFGSMAGARTFQGFCMAPFEALIPASVADVWHVHERGFRMAIFNLGVLGGINLAGPIGKPSLQIISP